MDVLVLSPCSKDKRYDLVLDCKDVDEYLRDELVNEHGEYTTTASNMYTGREHQHVKAAVTKLREVVDVDWYIISAGFGLLRDETKIPSYECGFSDIESVRTRARRAGYDTDDLTNDETIQTVGREKRIPRAFSNVLNREYDLLFVVLSEPYLLSVADALTEIPEQTTAFAFASNGSRQYVGDCTWIPATETERQALETTWMALRGQQFRELASSADRQELEQLWEHPERAETLSS
ncbi:hypothetical protein EFA46_001040 [Halarchaeum sp. CBA1220]|uniref:hypothetical protein n=1 Tax=Halarchaeum sp. CBA1220 TaxID=1853682 RepID=UPI000F3A939F|nr:hypothetical protein [Halarchaeum sp. CBA1220]QLC32852.1 hypothetical protein EFA46_001040 [Halarchaeum sp. CBA1220]